MKKTIISLVLAVCASAASAEIRNYECELHSIQAQGWIPPKVLLSVDAENKQARVLDGAIMSANDIAGRDEQTPMKAKFKNKRQGGYQMSWRVTMSSTTTRQLRVSYTAVLDPNSNKFTMRANFPMDNVTNRPSGVGHCTQVKGPNLF